MKIEPGKALVIAGVGVFGAGTGMGCAGPTTPLGAVWEVRLAELQIGMRKLASHAGERVRGDARIRFLPSRQVLHAPHRLRVRIEDSAGITDQRRIEVRHNGRDVSGAFLLQARERVSRDRTALHLDVRDVRLPPGSEHTIEVSYEDAHGRWVTSRYAAPTCAPWEREPWQATERFAPSAPVRDAIERVSIESGFNPSFTAALIAQESGFNPLAVSWARAIGLTQITPIAEAELEGIERLQAAMAEWPRFPGLADMPVPFIRAMILSGEVSAATEWRLDPERSVRGGLELVGWLARVWSSPENLSRIRQVVDLLAETGTDPVAAAEAERGRLILASYNSGYSRVSGALGQALSAGRADWIRDASLRAARTYVNRISSFCHHFANPTPLTEEVTDENET